MAEIVSANEESIQRTKDAPEAGADESVNSSATVEKLVSAIGSLPYCSFDIICGAGAPDHPTGMLVSCCCCCRDEGCTLDAELCAEGDVYVCGL